MKALAVFRATSHRLPIIGRSLPSLFALILVLLLSSVTALAAPLPPLDPPITFFTNVAQRLLKSELNLDLTQIQIYPTNQYTPAVHRLLQLAANLYDASTNRPVPNTSLGYPSVFRPLFTKTGAGTNIIISITGYQEVTNFFSDVFGFNWHDLEFAGDVQAVWTPSDMVYGIPLVVGAKKGWPNFNEFGLQTQVQVTRKLQFIHGSDPYNLIPVRTNQMYLMGISNTFGLELWNSYRTNLPAPLQLRIAVDQFAWVTNEFGLVLGPDYLILSNRVSSFVLTNIPASTWPAFSNPSDFSFLVPVFANYSFLTNCQYRFESPPNQFVPPNGIFESTTFNFPIPRWWLILHTRVLAILVDAGSSDRIVDYVNLSSTTSSVDITSNLQSDALCGSTYTPDGAFGAQWCTNRYSKTVPTQDSPTFGLRNQILLGMGWFGTDQSDGFWQNFIIQTPVGSDKQRAIDYFNAQFGIPSGYDTFPITNVFYVPFSPFRNLYAYTSWSANDPLVHYTIGDLTDPYITNLDLDIPYNSSITNLGRMNPRYEPWGGGGNPARSSTPTRFDRSLKDPSQARPLSQPNGSDDWNFPTNLTLDPSTIGRVHRGTPWQTIYLKSAAASTNTWMQWIGIPNSQTPNAQVARQMHPTNDWHIVSLLMPLLNTNDPTNLLPLNQPDVPSWRSALDSIVVQTNSGIPPTSVVMSSASSQAATIAASLNTTRSNRTGHLFRGLGEILAAPALSTSSPWLNTNSTPPLSDDAYEAIPSQLLTRLRPDSVASLVRSSGKITIQFTGFDDWRYAILTSSNLKDWTSLSTNSPVNGVFAITNPAPLLDLTRFYKSTLLP